MINLSPVITDEELGAAPFVILRRTYRKFQGSPALDNEERIRAAGVVHPAKAEETSLLPEEYRSEIILRIHSPQPLTAGRPLDALTYLAPDQILLDANVYQVISVRDWSTFGFCSALAVLRKGETAT